MAGVESTKTQPEENYQDFSAIYNYSLRDYLNRIYEELPQDQYKFYSLDLASLESAQKINFGGDQLSFDPSVILSFVTRLKRRKAVRFNTTDDKKPRNYYTRRRVLAAFTLFWASRTLAQEEGKGTLNWTKLEMVAKQVLQYHPIKKNILSANPDRIFLDQHHLVKRHQ